MSQPRWRHSPIGVSSLIASFYRENELMPFKSYLYEHLDPGETASDPCNLSLPCLRWVVVSSAEPSWPCACGVGRVTWYAIHNCDFKDRCKTSSCCAGNRVSAEVPPLSDSILRLLLDRLQLPLPPDDGECWAFAVHKAAYVSCVVHFVQLQLRQDCNRTVPIDCTPVQRCVMHTIALHVTSCLLSNHKFKHQHGKRRTNDRSSGYR